MSLGRLTSPAVQTRSKQPTKGDRRPIMHKMAAGVTLYLITMVKSSSRREAAAREMGWWVGGDGGGRGRGQWKGAGAVVRVRVGAGVGAR